MVQFKISRTVFKSLLSETTIAMLVIIFIFISACRKSDALEAIDPSLWEAGANGCDGYRLKTVGSLLDQQEKLLGKNISEIMSALGKPDKIALYRRSQRFYVYYLTPINECMQHTDTIPSVKSLQIRFSALDIANEIFIKEEFAPKP